ncbi:MAG: undecaprenyl/decaprenyl-phosphate alpha-N-acetylglucosaminyl 1-phosphate transferase [Chloroflexi bacterium]|nr:undecaprenyl/decaprenyl-phosphate alpha-N-acetylglucosaminyl 1-phosphate transferase [Chloroflexota bacterium]
MTAPLALAMIFGTALLIGLILVPASRCIGEILGLIDRPRPGEMQTVTVPRTGGYGVIAAFLAASVLSVTLVPGADSTERMRFLGLIAGLFVVLPIAYLDDRLRLGWRAQLAGQVSAALLPMAFGLWMFDISLPWGPAYALPLGLALPLTLFWVVGTINTMNWIDNTDGLAGGVALIAALILFVRAYGLDQISVAGLTLALAGAAAAFLIFNFHPARVFMGTSGSMFFGYALALLAIIGGAKVATALMVLGLPILDTALVIVHRLVAGRSPFVGGDSAHLPHRLAGQGWSVRRIVLTIYVGCLLLGLGGLTLSGLFKVVLFAAVLGGLGVFIAGQLLRSRRDGTISPIQR